ncbi:hypothetical protein Tco_0962028 [Tanacetum coccineum]
MSSSSTVTYTSVYTDSELWRFQWVFDEELEAPQSPRQAPPSLDYVPGPEHPPSPDYVPALSSGYIANSDLEEDPADYPADGGEEEEEEESSRAIWRVASPTTHHSSKTPSLPLLLPPTTHRDDLTKEDMPLQKRARFTAPTSRFEVGEGSSAAAARQAGHTLAYRVDYGLIDTVDASIRAAKSRAMTAIGEDNRALLKAQVSILIRERRYFRLMASSYEREAVIARQAWSHSECKIQAMEAQIRALQRDVNLLQRQRISDEDRLTRHIQHDHDRFVELVRTARELVRTAEAGP